MSTRLSTRTRVRGLAVAVRALVLVAPLFLAAHALEQTPARETPARESFLAIQRQAEALQPALVKATVALRVSGGSGSGVIISPDGYVLTAAHVISGPPNRRCTVVMSDGRTLPATILGADRQDDFGLVKIRDTANLPVAPLGDSSALHQGEWVLATGHPLGPQAGRPPVLRIGRVLRAFGGRRRSGRMVVTDAPLINGDSGGPLWDLSGRVVGIHSMIAGESDWMTSVHIPVNLAKAVLPMLRNGENPTPADVRSSPMVARLAEAQEALVEGDNALAARAATEAVSADPTSAMARVVLARALARTGKTAQAVAELEQACERGFDDADYLRSNPDLAKLQSSAAMRRLQARLDATDGIPGSRKGDQPLLAAAGGLEPNAGQGVVRLVAGGKTVALGTVMSADGDVITKASELPSGPVECALPDGRTVAAERQRVDSQWDVALLKIRASGLRAAPLADRTAVGEWTFSPTGSGGVAAVGMVSAADVPVRGRGFSARPTSKAYMGVALQPLEAQDLKDLGVSSGVGVEVEPGYPADRAGMRTGDVVYEMDGKAVRDPDQMMDLMADKKPGDSVTLHVARSGQKLVVTVNLASRPAGLPGRGGIPELVSGAVSRMQGPFPHVTEHDAVLSPDMMGGPVLDAQGRCMGVNIARADRTSTYMVAARDLKTVYEALKAAK